MCCDLRVSSASVSSDLKAIGLGLGLTLLIHVYFTFLYVLWSACYKCLCIFGLKGDRVRVRVNYSVFVVSHKTRRSQHIQKSKVNVN